MADLIAVAPWIIPLMLIAGAILLGGVLSFVPVRLWIEALAARVSGSLADLVGVRLRKVSPAAVIRPLISATKAGLKLDITGLEAHYLAGGNVDRVVKALISADKAGIELGFQRTAARNPAGPATR